jgi:F0F1-type ATP synthase membrane subunit b/b'
MKKEDIISIIREQEEKFDIAMNKYKQDITELQTKIDSVVEESQKQNEEIRESIKKILQ